MKRIIDATLNAWVQKKQRKPLLIRGARQTGKTFSIKQLGSTFPSFVEINFERDPRFISLFEGELSPIKIIRAIGALIEKKITPNETLLFFDEIQACPRALLAMRYFYEELPELHLIGAGSLLEFELQNISIPVGRIEFAFMRPLTFSEFLDATGRSILKEAIHEATPDEPLIAPLHNEALTLLDDYLFIGGMPSVVSRFVSTNSFTSAEDEQRSIIQTYRADFSKYCKRTGIEYVEKTFSALCAMIGRKTVYSQIDPDARAYQIKGALDLLRKARVVSTVRVTSGAGLPLEAGASEKNYKSIFLDVGLMQRQLGVSYAQWSASQHLVDQFRGAVAEQFVGQELLHRRGDLEDPGLFYWHRDSLKSMAEVDYLCEGGRYSIPIEVKSGAAGHLKSMHRFMETFIATPLGLKCSRESMRRDGKIITVPLYAAYRLMEFGMGASE